MANQSIQNRKQAADLFRLELMGLIAEREAIGQRGTAWLQANLNHPQYRRVSARNDRLYTTIAILRFLDYLCEFTYLGQKWLDRISLYPLDTVAIQEMVGMVRTPIGATLKFQGIVAQPKELQMLPEEWAQMFIYEAGPILYPQLKEWWPKKEATQ